MTFEEFQKQYKLWKEIRHYYGPFWRWRRVKW